MNATLQAICSSSAPEVAWRLLGCCLERTIDGVSMVVSIVETEAYDQTDQASHSFRGQTPRTAVMFGPPGYSYVYFTYGMHYCLNIVSGPVGEGSAVLIRAVEPLSGLEVLRRQRAAATDRQLTNGPAKLCQAMAITKELNGHDCSQKPLRLLINKPLSPSQIVATTRIGIRHDTKRPWRLYIAGNSYVSRSS